MQVPSYGLLRQRSRAIMGNYGQLWAIMGNYGQLWAIMGNYGQLWVASSAKQGNYGQSKASNSTAEQCHQGAMHNQQFKGCVYNQFHWQISARL